MFAVYKEPEEDNAATRGGRQHIDERTINYTYRCDTQCLQYLV